MSCIYEDMDLRMMCVLLAVLLAVGLDATTQKRHMPEQDRGAKAYCSHMHWLSSSCYVYVLVGAVCSLVCEQCVSKLVAVMSSVHDGVRCCARP